MRGEFVDVGGLRLYYHAAGTRGAGDPVLLLHGFATSAQLWRYVVPLVPAGHRVVAVDLPGHGRSEAVEHGRCTAGMHATLVTRLLDELRSGPVHVVAHGFGCEIALRLAEDEKRVRSLLLIAPAGSHQRCPGVPSSRSLPAVALRLPWTSVATQPLENYLSRGFASRASARRALQRHLQPLRTRARRTALAAQLQTIAGPADGETRIEQPFEIIAGDRDPFVSARRIQTRFLAPGSGLLTTLGGQRHFLPEEAPDTVAKVLSRLLS